MKSGMGIELPTVFTAGSIPHILAPMLITVADERCNWRESSEVIWINRKLQR